MRRSTEHVGPKMSADVSAVSAHGFLLEYGAPRTDHASGCSSPTTAAITVILGKAQHLSNSAKDNLSRFTRLTHPLSLPRKASSVPLYDFQVRRVSSSLTDRLPPAHNQSASSLFYHSRPRHPRTVGQALYPVQRETSLRCQGVRVCVLDVKGGGRNGTMGHCRTAHRSTTYISLPVVTRRQAGVLD